MSILNKYKKHKNIIRLLFDKYWDFVLSLSGDNSTYENNDICLSTFIDFSNKMCYDGEYKVVSLPEYSYGNAKTDNIVLENIGLTGIDNGLIRYDCNKITNRQFNDILYNSKLTLDSSDTRFHCSFVTGNTCNYDYSYDISDKFVSLKGGFLQGFFKLHGYDYEILPSTIVDEWNIEMTIRPRKYDEKDNTLNKIHPKNRGILFYLGSRAENKFSLLYNTENYDFPERDDSGSRIVDEVCCPYFPQDVVTDDYFVSDFVIDDYANKGCTCETNVYRPNEDGYYTEDVVFDNKLEELTDNRKDFEIATDNKFVYYNRTKTGLTTNNEDSMLVLTGNTDNSTNSILVSENGVNVTTDNGFLIYNRTKTGYTTNDDMIDTISNEEYDIIGDITGNSFCILRTENGSLGYRYLIMDCENKYTINEEIGTYNVLPDDEWHSVNVRFKLISGSHDDCGNKTGNNKMKIFIYVDGYLKFVSKELPEFDFKPLDESVKKQEGVPFNLSIGGGSQGLMESVLFDYKKINKKVLPIEENFAGSFIGDIKDFKFYTCKLNLGDLRKYI